MKYLLILGLLIISSLSFAQSNRFKEDQTEEKTSTVDPAYDWSWNTSGIPTTPPPPPTPVPIDGGIGFLLAAGCAFGLRSFSKKR